MPVPTSIADLSATPSSNYPGGGESPSTIDDYHRALCSIVRQVSDAKENTGVAATAITAERTAVATLTNKTLTSPTLTTPALGTPASGNLANCTFPTLNQNTSGSASSVSGTTIAAIQDGALGSGTADSTKFLRGDRTWGPSGGITSATAQNTTSGTSIDFTGIPSTAKRVTVMFNGVSTNGASVIQVQIGAGSVDTTGYNGSMSSQGGANTTSGTSLSTGIGIANGGNSADVMHGHLVLTNMGSNIWVASGVVGRSNVNYTAATGASKSLSGALDRIRLTTVNGTDAFDAGSVNIMYES